MQEINWTQHDEPQSALWRSERGSTAPKRVQLADDTLSADAAYRLASEGVGLLWVGDFQNARHLVQALDRRIAQHSARKNSRNPAGKTAENLMQAFHQQRQAQAHRAHILGSVLILLDAKHHIALRRAPDVHAACQEAWEALEKPKPSVCSLRELLGIISAYEWRKKGVPVPQLGLGRDKAPLKIHPHYGVFSPVRGEYLELVAQAPLPPGDVAKMQAIDVGTGTGVLAAVLAKRGIASVQATDLSPRAITCAQNNLARLTAQGFKAADRVSVVQANLFASDTQVDLMVCNPPWLPTQSTPSSALEQAVYDKSSQMLLGFLGGAAARLKPQGQAWLIMSDLAEHLGLRSRAELLEAIEKAGLKVLAKHDTQPAHPKSRNTEDPLFAARSKEVTSLWCLGKAEKVD